MSSTFEKTIQHYYDFAKKHGLPWIDPAPLVNEVDHKAFNYSLEEPILRRFGGYFDITEEYNFSTIQPCIRGSDVAAIKRKETKHHLSLFHIIPTSYHISPRRDELPKMQREGIKNTLEFLQNVGINLRRLQITYFPGSFLDELSSGMIPVHKYFPPDNTTIDACLDHGLKLSQLKPVASLDTFLATFGKNEDFWAGNKFEIFYPLPHGKLLEIGTGEAIRFRQIRHKNKTTDIVDGSCSVVPIAIGLERLQVILEAKKSIFEISPIHNLSLEFKKINLLSNISNHSLLHVADLFRAAHLVIVQTINLRLNKHLYEQRRVILKEFCSFFQDKMISKEDIKKVMKCNALIHSWIPELHDKFDDISSMLIENIERRQKR